jgi:hypothetical protein
MSTDRGSPGAGFFLTVAAVVALLYPASLGPSCWVSSRSGGGAYAVSVVYHPMLVAADVSPRPAWDFIRWYSEVGAAPSWQWMESKTWEHRTFRISIGPVIHLR